MTLKRWLFNSSLGNRRKSVRRFAGGFAATHWAGSGIKDDLIRNIGATGLFMLTKERWTPGTPVALTLHRAGFQETDPSGQVTLQARAIRSDDEGVGLAFDVPQGVEPLLWVHLVETSPSPILPDDIVGPFRMAKALAFLTRICAPAGDAVRQHVREMLSGNRLWNAIEIALQAEVLLDSYTDSPELRAPFSAVVRILHDGSWADEKPMQQCWAGLLTTACSPIKNDPSNLSFVELFSQLTPAHLRVLSGSCTKAAKFISDEGILSAKRLTASTEEIMAVSGYRDLLRMGRSLQHLSELGLLEDRFRTSMFIPVDGINVTPTRLGLELYARCNGFRGEPEAFYGLSPRAVRAMAG